MTDNRIYDSGAGTQKYCLSLNTGTVVQGMTFTGNQCDGNVASAFNLGASASILGTFNNNTGITPAYSGCSLTGASGGPDAGGYKSGLTGKCAMTITPLGTAQITSGNGWVCNGGDMTTLASSVQSASTSATATLTTSTTSGDKLNYTCRSW